MSKYLDPKADLTFKKVFGEHPNLVLSLLNALLPMPDGMEIKSVSYLTPENIPENPGKKYSIVDVYCTDNYGRHFIVEMQSIWNTEFFQRTLFNATSMYTKQLNKGKAFGELNDVYALCLVNDIKAFPDYPDEYMQEYYLINKNHTSDIHTDLSMVFVMLPKFKPENRATKVMHNLWLKFLTEIDEKTDDADPELLANKETSEALEIVRRSAFTDSELLAYDLYWLNVSTEKSSLAREYKDGHAAGLEEGEKIGEHNALLATARNMKAENMPLDLIARITNLPISEIEVL